MPAVADLEQVTSTTRACTLLGVSRATLHRRRRPVHGPRPPVVKARPAHALSAAEQAAVLEVLHSPEYCDLAPAQVWARLLDDGIYLCSESTMYRLLNTVGGVAERRRQATHPAKQAPELVADAPNRVWSWDITKLRGPTRGVWYQLYVAIDIYSRYVVGWVLAPGESATVAAGFIADAVARHHVEPGQLTVHADRGTSMTSKTVAQLLSDLEVGRTHSRPRVSNDNPYSEAQFRTLKYCSAFPERFGSIHDARTFCAAFFDHYNHVHRHSGIGMHTPASVHYGTAEQIRAQRAATLHAAYTANPARFRYLPPRPPELPGAAWINPPTQVPQPSQTA